MAGLTVRKLIVEVVDAHNLMPKDGVGTSSPYVLVEFDGQRKRTKTMHKDLNPNWNEKMEFVVSDPNTMAAEELEIDVYNDLSTGGGGRNHSLGRVRINGSEFVEKGDEVLIYFPLKKKNIFHSIKGELGLRVYYVDEPIAPAWEEKPTDEPAEDLVPIEEESPEQHPEAPPPAVENPAEEPVEASPPREENSLEEPAETSPLLEEETLEQTPDALPLGVEIESAEPPVEAPPYAVTLLKLCTVCIIVPCVILCLCSLFEKIQFYFL